ncbi:Tfp pilus assembly protein FimT/FimU [Neisseria sp. WLZKY-1]|jgi:prepilin-type N-cleavage/methylation domain protein|uniref:pilus assembly FimT family protein n=1 Tax=Neisseria sp. WLZKY-1 TaxID=3390377 RepID=UPI00397C6BFC
MKILEKGFTLVELMVTIAIMAIMAAIAVPNFSEWLAKRRVAAAAEKVANMIRLGRSEAARLNLPVYLCPVQIRKDGNPNGQCQEQYSGSGLMLWADRNLDKKYVRGVDDSLRVAIINQRSQGKNNSGDRIEYSVRSVKYDGSNAAKNPNTSVLAFLPDGSVRRITTGKTDATFHTNDPISGYVKFVLTDAKAEDEKTKSSRSVVLLVSGNQVKFCDRAGDLKACKYK